MWLIPVYLFFGVLLLAFVREVGIRAIMMYRYGNHAVEVTPTNGKHFYGAIAYYTQAGTFITNRQGITTGPYPISEYHNLTY